MSRKIPTKPISLRHDAPLWANDLVKQINEQLVTLYRQVYGQSGALTPATTSHALNSTFSDTEVEAALDTLGTRINEIQTVLEERQIVRP